MPSRNTPPSQKTQWPAYPASQAKRRRATAAEMEELRAALIDIALKIEPCTVRQVFYQATVRGLVDKRETEYDRVQGMLASLRRSGRLHWDAIVDGTREAQQPSTWPSPQHAVEALAQQYRKSLWADADSQVQVWVEKDALSGVIRPVTDQFDVPLMPARGYSSLSFLRQAANWIEADGRECFVYHIGDHDPSGVDAARKIEEDLRDFAPGTVIHFERLAVLPAQISQWNLPTRPTKESDTRSRGFDAESVEVDAIDPDDLRQLVRDAIARHIPPGRYAKLMAEEKLERASLLRWATGRRKP
jgi:hypothetical protein